MARPWVSVATRASVQAVEQVRDTTPRRGAQCRVCRWPNPQPVTGGVGHCQDCGCDRVFVGGRP